MRCRNPFTSFKNYIIGGNYKSINQAVLDSEFSTYVLAVHMDLGLDKQRISILKLELRHEF